ncbi:hypothetical protein WJX72_000341 [[Myrmecia] bisecta]|uniref:Aldehyde dehydrogenase domain-containing protein n=1 Tax=[Myrmecia] bisecta TaxID=41462 RepID=A0AAW1PFJ3_9CHLO
MNLPDLIAGLTECYLCSLAWIGIAALATYLLWNTVFGEGIPVLTVEVTEAEAQDVIKGKAYEPNSKAASNKEIPCYDPGNMQLLGHLPAMTASEVRARVERARVAAKSWKGSSFKQRKLLLKTILRYIIDHQETICRVSARDSGKPMLDAAFGEVLVTCEKISWLVKEGERHLRPEKRSAGSMLFYKSARVEYHPVGVVGAIVPWNYPFHNVFNPLTAAVFAGNSIVIKVSEHATWSSLYYGRIISAALEATGAPKDLVQIVTGYAEAGNALVTSGLGKLIFVGSTGVGRKVMQAAAQTLTPVVLELGGKDPVIVCDDADMKQVIPVAMRGAFMSCGQNCAGAERFIVQSRVYGEFVKQVTEVTQRLRQGHALGGSIVDCGAMCMPGAAEQVHALVTDAVSKGAKVLAGGKVASGAHGGQFYAPTVLVDVTLNMRIWSEEVFGPVLVVVKFETDDEAVELTNDCPFGLGSNVFCRNRRRANAIASRLEAGMTAINDFTTYMCQSLPFGGVKESGFDRFAGVEGLRGLCIPKSVTEDRWPWLMRTDMPPIIQYPVGDGAFSFTCGLVTMFYAPSWRGSLRGVATLLSALMTGSKKPAKKQQ